MSDTTTPAAHDAGHGGHGHHEDHSKQYIKIWGILLVLLVISVAGPFLGAALNLYVITLLTAFGIAFVKAFLVIKHFMHLTVEKKYIGFLMLTMLAFMLVFVGGVSPDVMKHNGQRWENYAAERVVKEGLEEDKKHGHSDHGAKEPAVGEQEHGKSVAAPDEGAKAVPVPAEQAPGDNSGVHPEGK